MQQRNIYGDATRTGKTEEMPEHGSQNLQTQGTEALRDDRMRSLQNPSLLEAYIWIKAQTQECLQKVAEIMVKFVVE